MPDIMIIKEPITRDELKKIAEQRFGDLVKGAVDVDHKIMAIGGELHIDEQLFLIEEEGSEGKNIWGINMYPEETGDAFIEFDSMINLKPNEGNRSRDIDNADTKKKVVEIVNELIK